LEKWREDGEMGDGGWRMGMRKVEILYIQHIRV
jgi:hypothetical protein